MESRIINLEIKMEAVIETVKGLEKQLEVLNKNVLEAAKKAIEVKRMENEKHKNKKR